ncbi:pyridoxal-phosphate dependent enzyme [Pseudaestuariivita atlantica]|uniref:Diaminopropionate ammonia-lyase n=1 Tax=Pseudaestuariivita atlantica TaxID=1317121 RepID=A0A0L1JNF3_9RHOB|nr:pyridoxal-phosphate dependent enzyme [Pseudaestuariivita atlantica]KNG93247.1 diaminopropionate ammonia-lyase [Pseudaestuariivita atlantica]
MKLTSNPYRGAGLDHPSLSDVPEPSTDWDRPRALLTRCPRANTTPLVDAAALAAQMGVAQIDVKDERGRMGLGSFKALGAAYVIACDALDGTARGATYVTASAGNHGLSVAAGAQAFGARAEIHIARTVPEAFADRLRALDATVVRSGDDYAASMEAAAASADASGARLLSDSSWAGYTERPHRLMEGYLVMMAEAFDQIAAPPTHIFLQAGVGGLAGAAAAAARAQWGDGPVITVVEPENAPALAASIAAGAPVVAEGPDSHMGRLDCKEPSLIALKGLARDADAFLTLTEDEGATGAAVAAAAGLSSTSSGAAGLGGLAALDEATRGQICLTPEARVFVILSEGPEA